MSSGVIVIDQVTLGRLRVEWLGGLVGCMMLGDEDDARAGYCETELMSAQGLEINAVGFDARSTLTDFRGIGWFRKFGKSSPSVLGVALHGPVFTEQRCVLIGRLLIFV